jgi:hypothetical protein
MRKFSRVATLGVLALAAVVSTATFGQVPSSSKGAKKDAPAKQTTPVKPPEKPEAVSVKPAEPTVKKFTLAAIQGDRVDLAATRLPVETLIDAVKKAAVVSKKGEFESTADYEARRTAARSTIFLSGSTLNDTFAISIPVSKWAHEQLAYTFNPDASEGAFFVLPATSTGGSKGIFEKREYGPESGIDFFKNLANNILSKSTYEGSNAYGAKVTVEKTVSVTYGLAANRIPFLPFSRKDYYGSDLASALNLAVIRFKMDGATASKTIPDLKALIVFSIREPFIMEDGIHVEPKRDRPVDIMGSFQYLRIDVIGIVWYSQATGEIFARLPENFGKPAVESTQGADPAVAPASGIKSQGN